MSSGKRLGPKGWRTGTGGKSSGVALYEALKGLWRLKHPDSTPEEYTRAMVRIARLCGV